jgi:hypothetical protein
LCFGSWILAALGLIGLNGFHLLALETRPLVGNSPTIKALRANLSRWEHASATHVWLSDDSALKPVFVRYRRPPTDPATAAAVAENRASLEAPESITLPVLTGMLNVLDRRGRQNRFAVLNGRVCSAGDQVEQFVVERITPLGVVLNRDGQRWHIDSPSPDYSKNQGN